MNDDPKLRGRFILIAMLLIVTGNSVIADEPKMPVPAETTVAITVTVSADDMEKLRTNRLVVEQVRGLESNGVIVDEDGLIVSTMMKESSDILGRTVTFAELQEITKADPTKWQQFSGFMTFTNVVLVTAGFMLVLALGWLFTIYILPHVLGFPPMFHEISIYVGSAALVWSATLLKTDFQLLTVLPGCLGLVGGLTLTHFLHFRKSRDDWEGRRLNNERIVPRYYWICAIVWAGVAAYFGSSVIGFMSVMALLAALRFVAGVDPFCVFIGFDRDAHIPGTTMAAFALTVVYVVLSVPSVVAGLHPQVLSVTEPFMTGLSFMGPFVYFLGLLLMANKYYLRAAKSDSYMMMQIVTIASGIAVLWIGNTLGLTMLVGVGGTFFYLYLIEKYYELPWGDIGWAWSMLGLSAMLYGFVVFAKLHPEYFIFV